MGMSQVSHFAFLRYFGTDMLNLELYRSDLHVAASMPGPMDSMSTFRSISAWLHDSGASQVSHLNFWHLADLYRFGFDSSASASRYNKSIQTICGTGGWHR